MKDPLPQPGGEASETREKLLALRTGLLRLHKVLLEFERRDYERANGRVSSGELYRLVVSDAQFAWLHNISEFVVRLDELLDGEAVSPAEVSELCSVSRKMFAASESGDTFQKKYFHAIQKDPAVAMELAGLARLFAEADPG